MMPDTINMNDAALTNEQAINIAFERLTSVVGFCLDKGLEPDEMDKKSIRKAHEMLALIVAKFPRESV